MSMKRKKPFTKRVLILKKAYEQKNLSLKAFYNF